MREMEYLEELTSQYSVLEVVKGDAPTACEILRDYYAGGGKVMITENGGNRADSGYIVGELMRGFIKRRPMSGELAAALRKADEKRGEELASCSQGGLPATALTNHAGLSIAFLNDINGEVIYTQQLYGYGEKGDIFTGIFTSSNAKSVVYAVVVAKASGTKAIGLTGKNGGKMVRARDCFIVVPSGETFKTQELHLPVYHVLCLMLEEHFYEV